LCIVVKVAASEVPARPYWNSEFSIHLSSTERYYS